MTLHHRGSGLPIHFSLNVCVRRQNGKHGTCLERSLPKTAPRTTEDCVRKYWLEPTYARANNFIWESGSRLLPRKESNLIGTFARARRRAFLIMKRFKEERRATPTLRSGRSDMAIRTRRSEFKAGPPP